jgi:hypothetical protein
MNFSSDLQFESLWDQVQDLSLVDEAKPNSPDNPGPLNEPMNGVRCPMCLRRGE